MNTDTIYNYDELKLKLLKFSEHKIIYEESNNIKFLDIKKRIENYKKEFHQNKQYITVFIVSNNKVTMQYDERLDKFNLKIFDPYMNEKDNLKIIIYFFDTRHKNTEYISFLNICESLKLKINFKNYISVFSKINLPINGFFGICFTFFTIFALSEYGIPITKVTDFHIIVILQIFSILFLTIILSFFSVLVIILFIPFLLYIYVDYNNLFVLTTLEITILLLLNWYLKKNYPNLLNKLPIFIIKSFFSITAFFSISFSVLILTIMSQSIFSSFFSLSPLYDKSGYELAINEYITRFSGYPKILTKNDKEYYVPVADSNYYYIYDIEKSKKQYISDLKEEKMKSKLNSICKDNFTKKEFQKNFIVNNAYIKPQFLIEKISINDSDAKLEPLKLEKLIKLEEINTLCKK
ncbi:hypothetical protein ACOL3I_01680 [Aliarcobacter butzleri]